jgi:hypothetical protein
LAIIATFAAEQQPSVADAPHDDSTSNPASYPAPSTIAKFSFRDGSVRLTGSGDVSGVVLLSADRLDTNLMAAALEGVTDLKMPEQDATEVTFEASKSFELQPSASGRTWVLPVRVKNLPVNAEQSRFAQIRFAGKIASFEYSLSNRPSTPVEFDLSMRDQWVVTPGHVATALLVTSRDQPVSGLRIALAKLSEQTLGLPIETQALELCVRAAGECAPTDVIPAHSSRTLFLRWKDEALRSGIFKGTIEFAADAAPTSKTLPVEVASSNWGVRLLGALVIVVSVLLAWLVNVRGRLVIARLSALKLTTAARAGFADLLRRVESFEGDTGIKLDRLTGDIDDRGNELSEAQLDAHSLLPSTSEFYKAFDDSGLRAQLAQSETALKATMVVVRDGIEVLQERWSADTAGGERQDIAKAAMHLNVHIKDEATAENLVKEALDMLPAARGETFDAEESRTPSNQSAELNAQIESTNMIAWYVYLVLVSVGGISLLVVKAPGFGTSLDFVYCFFWGFGLPTALDKLQQLTPSGVVSALSVSVPK